MPLFMTFQRTVVVFAFYIALMMPVYAQNYETPTRTFEGGLEQLMQKAQACKHTLQSDKGHDVKVCVHACGTAYKKTKIIREKGQKTNKPLTVCLNAYDSVVSRGVLSEDPSALLAAKEQEEKRKQEESTPDIIELGDVEGKIQSLRKGGHDWLVAVTLNSTRSEFNTLCKGAAAGRGHPSQGKPGDLAKLKDVQYIKHKTPNAVGKCRFTAIILEK